MVRKVEVKGSVTILRQWLSNYNGKVEAGSVTIMRKVEVRGQ
jgi:hypothetical protein